MMLFAVTCSSNSTYENESIITIVMLLQRYALLSGMKVKIFCQSIAYIPMEAMTPPKNKMYGREKVSCCEAYLLHNPVKEYMQNDSNRNVAFPMKDVHIYIILDILLNVSIKL